MKELDTERLVVRVREAARLLSISRAQAYALIQRGELPYTRIGQSLRVPLAALKKIAEKNYNPG